MARQSRVFGATFVGFNGLRLVEGYASKKGIDIDHVADHVADHCARKPGSVSKGKERTHQLSRSVGRNNAMKHTTYFGQCTKYKCPYPKKN